MLFRCDPGPGEWHKCMGKGVIRVGTLAPFIILKKAWQLQMLAGGGMHSNGSGVTGLLEFYNACA